MILLFNAESAFVKNAKSRLRDYAKLDVVTFIAVHSVLEIRLLYNLITFFSFAKKA
jgi:hypothetical protein